MRLYSPGTLLLLEMIAAGPSQGLSRIDLGKGRAFYKQRLANDAVPLVEGTVLPPGWRASVCLGALSAKEWMRRSPFFTPFLELKRRISRAASVTVHSGVR